MLACAIAIEDMHTPKAFPPAVAPRGVAPDRTVRHFNQIDLARRWNVSPRTLERWRWLKQGPRYLKVGGRVLYRLEDIEVFEAGGLHCVEKERW